MNRNLWQGCWNSSRIQSLCTALSRRYSFVNRICIGRSVMGREIPALRLGWGNYHVLYHGAHHANEWITAPLLLRFVCELTAAASSNRTIGNIMARELLSGTCFHIIPAVNPDGIDLVTGALHSGSFYCGAKRIADKYPHIPFPDGWKANIKGIDLNLQYPAGWEEAQRIKSEAGISAPAPRDYVGIGALCAPEARAVYEYTLQISPALTLSYHTQGREIYWQFKNFAPPGAQRIAEHLAACSGYRAAQVPYSSSFAGYKDWFLLNYRRPAFTIEAGCGENPLPITQFEEIYRDNLEILLQAAQANRFPACF